MKSQLVVRISMTVYDNESGPGIVFDGQPTWNTIEIWVTKGMKEVIINTLPVDRGTSCLEAALGNRRLQMSSYPDSASETQIGRFRSSNIQNPII